MSVAAKHSDRGVASLHDLAAAIPPLSATWQVKAQTHLDSLTKPHGSLGLLEGVAARLVAIQEREPPVVTHKAVFVFAADHGVAAEGVSAYPSAVTEQMVLNFLRGGAAINVLARATGAAVHIVDVGVDAEIQDSGLIARKVRRSSRNLLHEPALSRQELLDAMQCGADLAARASADGVQLVALGEMGIGNTTAASAMTAVLTRMAPELVTGSGTGVTGDRFQYKQRIVAEAVKRHFPRYLEQQPDAIDVLRCLGGLEIAAIVGFILDAARRRLAMVIDGFISTAAAAVACLMAPAAVDYLFAGHLSEEAGHRFLLNLIGVKPLLCLNMRLGEGTGAVLAFSVIEAAARLYAEMATFQSAGVSGVIAE